MNFAQLSMTFILQLLVILGTCRLAGWILTRFLGQPQVIGDMIAGIMLGPTLFGAVAPDLQRAIFTPDTRPILNLCAQAGIGLYMFLVGLGFRKDHFQLNVRSAVTVSLTGILAPFLLAVLCTPLMLRLGLFGEGITGFEASLFIGVAVSITAFPVLARIIDERGLAGTPLAALALSAGAIDDAIAWTIFAILLACLGADPSIAVKAIAGGGLFALTMLALGPKLLQPLNRRAESEGRVSLLLLAIILMLFGASAYAMDAVGLHSVFGGFLLGVVMPRGILTQGIKARLEPLTLLLLVPLFFTFSGLNTRLAVVDSPALILIALAILAGSILTKGGACWAAARLTGQDRPTALAVGALMNARGLMELLVINIGLQRGIIGPALFSMLVLMTIVTTIMATPAIDMIARRKLLGDMRDDDPDTIIPTPLSDARSI
ncbi:cation:proton antiporter [Sphingobium sp.]|uniref:cation:proton antiporter n=1 Tax=Sphingobium sp. TaxID=1912891 RepID=UPI003B3AFA0E